MAIIYKSRARGALVSGLASAALAPYGVAGQLMHEFCIINTKLVEDISQLVLDFPEDTKVKE